MFCWWRRQRARADKTVRYATPVCDAGAMRMATSVTGAHGDPDVGLASAGGRSRRRRP